MKLISEEAHDIEFLTEATKDGNKNYFIEGVFMQAETKNRNGRVYPMEVLQKEAKDTLKVLSRLRELSVSWGTQMVQLSILKESHT